MGRRSTTPLRPRRFLPPHQAPALISLPPDEMRRFRLPPDEMRCIRLPPDEMSRIRLRLDAVVRLGGKSGHWPVLGPLSVAEP